MLDLSGTVYLILAFGVVILLSFTHPYQERTSYQTLAHARKHARPLELNHGPLLVLLV